MRTGNVPLGFVLSTGWLLFLATSAGAHEEQVHVLVFSKTAGFRHGSITTGISAIQELGAANDFEVFTA